MRFAIKKVEPIGTRIGYGFVCRGSDGGGIQEITSEEYPPSPGGELLRAARVKHETYVTIGKGAARLGLRAEQLSGLEQGRYTFADPADFESAAEILRGKLPKRADGWPLCPVCNEDELGCLDMARDYESLQGNVAACLAREMFCYRCAHTYPAGTFADAEVRT